MDINSAKNLARLKMIEHGIGHWTFQFDNSVSRFGYAHPGTRTISLSRKLVALNPEAEVLNTILHEIAHALTPGHHHDNVWRAKAVSIGCTGSRTHNAEVPVGKWTLSCTTCDFSVTRNRRRNDKPACPRCCARIGVRYSPDHLLVQRETALV
jgi:predicted SprT family Zn-dependent metalloprotease